MATPFTVKYPPKKTTVTPINQSRVSASTAPNMSVAPKAAPVSPVTPSAGSLWNPNGSMNFGAVVPAIKEGLGAIKDSFAPMQTVKSTPAPFGGAVNPSLLTPKVEEQKKQKTIPQNPPSKTRIALVGTPPATPSVTPSVPSTPSVGMTQVQQQQARDAITGTQTTTDEQVANYERAKQIKALKDRYTASLGQSQEEIDAQRQLDNLIASKELGIQAASEQPIEMGFITGQQKNITERAAVQAEPLKARLAALQAKRQAEATQAKSAYEEATGQGAEKPIEVGGSLVQFNPETGKYEPVYKGTTAAEKPVVLGQGETLVDPTTGKPIAKGQEKAIAEKKRDTQVVEVGGRMKLVDTQTGAEISDLGKKDSTGEISDTSPNAPQNILAELVALKNDPNKAGAVGLARWNPLNKLPGGPINNFDAKFATVQSLLALPNLGLLKGAMSDNDLKFIKSAGSSLQTSTSLEQFDATLDQIIQKYQAAVEKQSNMGGDNEFANKWLQ